MIPAKHRPVGRPLESLWTSGTLTGLSDAQLLVRFNGGGADSAEPAFRALVERHGPMVMGVCRQILRRPQDADDAFQATFLVLVRKARSIRVGDSLAPWLYGVAYRTAHRARASASRYRTGDVEPMAEAIESSPDGTFELDVRPLLHEELSRLPEKYRAPIVLCHLEGKSHEEAAGLLSWPVGTVSGRLSRGRQLLKDRLERRGVSVPSAALAARWLTGSQAIVSSSMVDSTLVATARFAAAGTLSTSVLSLTQGVLRTMFLNQIRAASLALVAVGAASGGVAWAIRTSQAGNPPAGQSATATPSPAQAKPSSPPADPLAAPSARTSIPKSVRRKNAPNMVDPQGPMPYLRSSQIIVTESPDRRSLRAISLQGPKDWETLTLPPDVTASPMISEDVVAPIFKGPKIDRVAVFSKLMGQWLSQALRKPAEERIEPLIMPRGAVYQVGNDVYAFSAITASWGALHLEGPENPRISTSANDIIVLQGNRMYVFSLWRGRFSSGVEFNPEAFQFEAHRKPGRPADPTRGSQ